MQPLNDQVDQALSTSLCYPKVDCYLLWLDRALTYKHVDLGTLSCIGKFSYQPTRSDELLNSS